MSGPISALRHMEIFNPLNYNQMPISIIGTGALGSRAFMSLVELGLTNIRLFDFDVVEAHNLANQAFNHSHIGCDKGAACIDLYQQKTGNKDVPEGMKYFEGKLPDNKLNDEIEGVVFLMVDSMEARKEIFEVCLKDNPKVFFVVEGRMASSYGNILTFNPQSSVEYNEWLATLTNDDEAEVSACGSSISVGTTVNIFANLAVWQYILWNTEKTSLQKQINMYLKPFTAAGIFYE